MLRECVVLVTVCVFGVSSLTGRGFFCRDPDTGKLHPANSTWSATTFCGKYHCKIKRKNITSSQYAPLRELNITSIPMLDNNLTTVDVTKKEVSSKKEEAVKTVVGTNNKTEPDIVDSNNTLKTNKPLMEYQVTTTDNIIDDKNESNKDRYLSDQEIKSLTEILHTLKKGDLDAIVEIYNLAQDIYKELDKTSTDHVLQEAMSTAETLNKQIFNSDMFKKMTKQNDASYWYEPLASGKIKVAEVLRPEAISNDINPEIPVTMHVPSLAAAVNVDPTEGNTVDQMSLLPPIPGIQMRKMSEYFFNGPLTYKDFGKLPYYYPMSNFQRSSSYKHEQKAKLTATPASIPAPTLGPAPVPNLVHKSVKNLNKTLQIGVKYQKELTPFIFLPHPLTIMRNYNWTFPQNMYHRLETRRKEQSLFDQLEMLRKDDDLYGMRRKEENISDKLELPKKEENVLNQLGKHRKQENILDKLEFLNKEENLFNQLRTHRKEENFVGHLENRRRQHKLSDKLDVLTKEENLFNQFGTRRKQENLSNKLELLTKEGNFFNQLGSRRKEENFVDQIGTRKKEDNPSDKLEKIELLTIRENLFNQLGTRKNEEKLFGKLTLDTNVPNGRDDNTITINRRADKKSSNNILMHPGQLDNFQDLQLRSSMKEENTVNTNIKQEEVDKGHRLIDRRRPDWQTDSLPQQILDEVRAHIQEKQRVFIHHVPLRKKVKLERVGKLLNMDKLTRVKRSDAEQSPLMDSIDESLAPQLYEVFIESITCNADYETPGFFRYGNLSQPYPECCPQRIPTR